VCCFAFKLSESKVRVSSFRVGVKLNGAYLQGGKFCFCDWMMELIARAPWTHIWCLVVYAWPMTALCFEAGIYGSIFFSVFWIFPHLNPCIIEVRGLREITPKGLSGKGGINSIPPCINSTWGSYPSLPNKALKGCNNLVYGLRRAQQCFVGESTHVRQPMIILFNLQQHARIQPNKDGRSSGLGWSSREYLQLFVGGIIRPKMP
jgi:hypothetical protein